MIKVPARETCYNLYHSGVADNTERHGVANTLNEAAQVALLASRPISPRLTSVPLKGVSVNLTVEAIYAPTLDATEEAKGSFYDDLQDAIDSTPSGNMMIVAGE